MLSPTSYGNGNKSAARSATPYVGAYLKTLLALYNVNPNILSGGAGQTVVDDNYSAYRARAASRSPHTFLPSSGRMNDSIINRYNSTLSASLAPLSGDGLGGTDYQDTDYNRYLNHHDIGGGAFGGADDSNNLLILQAQKLLPALRQLCSQQRDFFISLPSPQPPSSSSSSSPAAAAAASPPHLLSSPGAFSDTYGGGSGGGANDTPTVSVADALAVVCDMFGNFEPKEEVRTDWFSSSIALLNMVYVPMIIVLGLVGNSLSFMVYLQTRLKVRSSSQYLAALAATDSLFLVNLMCTWIDEDLMTYTASCRALNYMTHVAAFLSAWYVVAFTVERFIAIQFPFHKKHVCSVKRAQYVVFGLLVFGAVFNLPALTPDVVKGQCVPPSSLASAWKILSVVDMCVTHAIPTLGLVAMNTLISRELFRFSAKYRNHPPSPTVLMTGTNSQLRNSDAQVVDQQQHSVISTRRGHALMASAAAAASHASCNGVGGGPSTQNNNNNNNNSGGLFHVSQMHQQQQQQQQQIQHPLQTASGGGSSQQQHSRQQQQQQIIMGGGSGGGGGNNVVVGMDGGSVSSSATERPNPISASAVTHDGRCRAIVAQRIGPNGIKIIGTTAAQAVVPMIPTCPESERNILSRGTQRRITKTLLIVSSVTIILNLPSHVMRLITAFGDTGKEAEPKLANFQQLAMLLYYTNFSINFILYAMCGKNFRKCLVEYIRRLVFQCKRRTRNINDSFEMR